MNQRIYDQIQRRKEKVICKLSPEYHRLVYCCNSVGGDYDVKVKEARDVALKQLHPLFDAPPDAKVFYFYPMVKVPWRVEPGTGDILEWKWAPTKEGFRWSR